MEYRSFAISGAGLVRDENQDNLFVNGVYRDSLTDNSVFRYGDNSFGRGVYAVADGMGGESYGALAALMAVEAMDDVFLLDNSVDFSGYLIKRNAAICSYIRKNNGIRIGSTFVGVSFSGSTAVFANIGDSRCYLLHEGIFEQLSKDHTVVHQIAEHGITNKEIAYPRPDRTKLTQHLGIFPDEMLIEPYIRKVEVLAGDVFLLCSDGLTDFLDDGEILGVLETHGTIGEKSEALFDKAMKRGGMDNFTVILIAVC